MSLGVGVWVMSTDEVAALAAVVGIHPVKTVKTDRPAVALLVQAPAGELALVARRLEHDGLQASLATSAPLTRGTLRTLASDGDVPIPTIRHAGLFGWLRTSSQLRHEQSEPGTAAARAGRRRSAGARIGLARHEGRDSAQTFAGR